MNRTEDLLLRSIMFLPAHNTKFIDKALTGDADAIVLDMEDAVPAARKAEARRVIADYSRRGLLSQKKVLIRLNHIGTKDFVDDISELVLPGVYGFIAAKIFTAEDIVFIDKLLTFFEIKNGLPEGQIALVPLIETTEAVENAAAIAGASERSVALGFGAEDYLNDLGSTYIYQESALVMPRAKVVNAARMNGILPIDTPYLNIRDIEGLKADCKQGYKNGFAGRFLLSPRQVEAANEAYLPDEEQIAHARRVIEAVEEANKTGVSGVAMLDGAMVGPPMLKRARTIMKQIEMAGK